MKIAYIVHDLGKERGHDRYVAELIENLPERHVIHVFASSFQKIKRKNLILHKVPIISSPIFLKILTYAIVSFPIIWLVHKREKFDIIHYQGALSIPIAPAVITAHTCSVNQLQIYRKFSRTERLIQRVYHHIYTYMNIFLEKVSFRNNAALKIIAPSESAKKDLMRNYEIKTEKIVRIYEGVNSSEFSINKSHKTQKTLRQNLNIDISDFVILFIGDYLMKGLQVAIKAIKNLECRLIVLGRGDMRHYGNLALKEGVSNNVIFSSHRLDVFEYFAIADVLLFPTYYDTFGLVALEALSSGVPCMVSEVAGVCELLENGKNAILLDYPFSKEKIREKLRRLIEDDDFRRRIAEEGRSLALRYTWEKVAKETEGLYEDLHAGKR